MGRYSGKTCRLLSMLALTGSFFIVEITVGYISNSIALVADSFHMLSDVVALIVGFASVRVSKWKTKKNTFGWQRAEVLGALVNTVFLIALCFTIVVESLQRFIEIEEIREPKLLLIVGALGLLINIVGLVLFHRHGHGHSHGGHSHHDEEDEFGENFEEELLVEQVSQGGDKHPELCNGDGVTVVVDGMPNDGKQKHFRERKDIDRERKTKKPKSSAHLNMKGVFLHVLGDALGSVVVIISAAIIWKAEGQWRFYVDPGLSMLMVIIMLGSAIPLLKETSLILLQTVPTHIQVKSLQDKLIRKVDGVLAVHEFHIWRLAGDRIIASAHIKCRNLGEYMRVAEQVKEFFHNEGIHSTTIQPEFEDLKEVKMGRSCVLECGPDKTCYPNTCCGEKKVIAVIREKSPSQIYRNRHSAISGEFEGTSGNNPISVISSSSVDKATAAAVSTAAPAQGPILQKPEDRETTV